MSSASTQLAPVAARRIWEAARACCSGKSVLRAQNSGTNIRCARKCSVAEFPDAIANSTSRIEPRRHGFHEHSRSRLPGAAGTRTRRQRRHRRSERSGIPALGPLMTHASHANAWTATNDRFGQSFDVAGWSARKPEVFQAVSPALPEPDSAAAQPRRSRALSDVLSLVEAAIRQVLARRLLRDVGFAECRSLSGRRADPRA